MHHFTKEELITNFITSHPELEKLVPEILEIEAEIVNCYQNGGKLFTCGNGGSASDSAHIVGELLKGFLSKRDLSQEEKERFSRYKDFGDLLSEKLQGSLAAIDLTAQSAIISAVSNDTDPCLIYAQQLWGLGKKGDVLIGISTSGNAKNVLCAAITAKELGMKTIALTGCDGGKMNGIFDYLIKAPSDSTPSIQEYHICIYHLLCALIETDCFD